MAALPVAAGRANAVPAIASPVEPPATGDGGVPDGPPAVTEFDTGTGMLRIVCSSPRSRSGQRTVTSKSLPPSWIWVAARPPTADWMASWMSAGDTPHLAHFCRSTENSRFDCPWMRNTPGACTPGTSLSTSRTLKASSSSVSRSGPTILIEFSPLTPDSASMTLSRMICEMSKSTPGKLASNASFRSRTSSALVRGRPRSGRTGHSGSGRSGMNASRL